jgi:hypothetical protein
MLVFIDESGDPGFKLQKGSTPIFVAALVAFNDHDQARAADDAIGAAAIRLKVWPEFRFSKCRDEIRDAFFEAVRPFTFRVRAVVVQKERIYSPHLRMQKEAFYSFFVKSMLKFDEGLLKEAQIVIDGSGDRTFKREMGAYFRRHLGVTKIKSLVFNDSRSDRLVQLADMCAGAIARSFSTAGSFALASSTTAASFALTSSRSTAAQPLSFVACSSLGAANESYVANSWN